MKFLNLSFIPLSPGFGLLVMRAALGLSMLLLHGLPKFQSYAEKAESFPGVFGMPSNVALGLAIFAEVGCSALLVIGFLTRFAALNLAVTMGVAFFVVHGGALSGDNSGELAFTYLVGFTTLFFTGAGGFSIDQE